MALHTEKKNPAQAVVSSKTRLDWYRQMCRIRAFERAVYSLSKAGLIAGTAHLYIGMEAIAVGSCSAVARRLPVLEAELVGITVGDPLGASVRPEHLASLSPIDDVRATAAYRIDASLRLLQRALNVCGEKA